MRTKNKDEVVLYMGQVQEKEQQDEERRQWKKQEEKQNYSRRELTRKPVWPLENCV